jgi:hypothetical protein
MYVPRKSTVAIPNTMTSGVVMSCEIAATAMATAVASTVLLVGGAMMVVGGGGGGGGEQSSFMSAAVPPPTWSVPSFRSRLIVLRRAAKKASCRLRPQLHLTPSKAQRRRLKYGRQHNSHRMALVRTFPSPGPSSPPLTNHINQSQVHIPSRSV